jgi:hypothetical protein
MIALTVTVQDPIPRYMLRFMTQTVVTPMMFQ